MKKILINFTNPYIFFEHILENIYDLKRNSQIEIFVVVTNYYIPINLERELSRMKDEETIVDFFILKIYTNLQMPKGRRVAFISKEIITLGALKRSLLRIDFDLLILETTNELIDLFFLHLIENARTKVCLLKPVESAPLEKVNHKSKVQILKVPYMVMIRTLIYLEKIERSLIYFLMTKEMISPRKWPEIDQINRVTDLVITADELSMNYLEKHVRSKKFVLSSFKTNRINGVGEPSDIILVLLPFSGDRFSVELSEALKSAIFMIQNFGAPQKIRFKPHPRSNPKSLTRLISYLQLTPDKFENVSTESLGSLIQTSSVVILSGESSTAKFLINNFPDKSMIIVERDFSIKDLRSARGENFTNNNSIRFELGSLLEE